MEKFLSGMKFDGVDEGDLNKTWAMLSQLRASNPAKYTELIDYMKKGQEEFDRLEKMVPVPHSVYTGMDFSTIRWFFEISSNIFQIKGQ